MSLVFDDVSPLAPAFLDPDVGGEAGLPPLAEDELRAFTRDRLPQMQAAGVMHPGRGRGAAARTARALADHAFASGIARVEAVVRPANARSIRVLERVGFTCEGLLRSFLTYRGSRTDAYMYSLLAGG